MEENRLWAASVRCPGVVGAHPCGSELRELVKFRIRGSAGTSVSVQCPLCNTQVSVNWKWQQMVVATEVEVKVGGE